MLSGSALRCAFFLPSASANVRAGALIKNRTRAAEILPLLRRHLRGGTFRLTPTILCCRTAIGAGAMSGKTDVTRDVFVRDIQFCYYRYRKNLFPDSGELPNSDHGPEEDCRPDQNTAPREEP